MWCAMPLPEKNGRFSGEFGGERIQLKLINKDAFDIILGWSNGHSLGG